MMKLTLPMAAVAFLITTAPVLAAEKKIRSEGAALATCKAAAQTQLNDVEHVKMLSISHKRKQYQLKLRVRQAGERQMMHCFVTRDGAVEFKSQ